jgi:hypothetical protein
MDCGNFQNLISSFLDGELDARSWEPVSLHINGCEDCSRVYEDLSAIISFCDESFTEDTLPPNSQALWCRINNIIETEVAPEIEEERASHATPGRLASMWNSTFRLSPMQLASAVLGVALVSSLLTVVAFKNFSTPGDPVSGSEGQPSVFDKVLADLGLGESPRQRNERRIKEQEASISYWKARVDQRRAQWNVETRDVFDRNLSEVDKAVSEYSKMLRDNPQDTISNEMLDSALKEKMELLREFSEL